MVKGVKIGFHAWKSVSKGSAEVVYPERVLPQNEILISGFVKGLAVHLHLWFFMFTTDKQVASGLSTRGCAAFYLVTALQPSVHERL